MEDFESVDEVIKKHRMSGRFFSVDGVQSFALDYGNGEAVLCLHGVPTSSFLYRKVLWNLAHKGFRGVSIDLPGLGFADRPEDFDYSFPNFARYLAKAAEALNLDRFHLVVHDIGGPIGFALAAQNKDKILSLTILNTWIDVVNFEKPLPMRPLEKPLLDEAELATITHTTWRLAFDTMGVSNADKTSKEEIYAYVDLLKREDDGKAFLKIMHNFDHSEEYRDLCLQAVQNVPYPVQAIWGAEDPGLRYDRYGEEIKKAAGLEEVLKLPAKHLLQEEQWEVIADKIAEQASRPPHYK
ncbi:pimeloyl-ACP methyl ester carboxylesterase [Pontibacter ummariensis]|uniref:Pimeloyl-ACP methyl ester carboxylesterase n=1 Tax=Pontibacter ummariensis TaxID=1610492 RepID=A0A239IC29_9BACT|nr:alpha/beta hydrolase [Pontibacter ummariensis]PRY09948.1 pimeloyl-ACP methyl ester carboxylesterase [Pontibacter ummariensis]SNS90828.1 Pimeloyl-ACP methyl ester carboxylesterase [Pontibacter ummariensis]